MAPEKIEIKKGQVWAKRHCSGTPDETTLLSIRGIEDVARIRPKTGIDTIVTVFTSTLKRKRMHRDSLIKNYILWSDLPNEP
jgi:hypothetical protein